MAYVKVHFIKHVQNVLQYIQRELGEHDLVAAVDCTPKTAHQRFADIRSAFEGQGEINGLHIIQSWGPEDSRKLDGKSFESFGKQLVETYFPGHAYVIATHTGTGKTHNHIVVCPWHSETGKKIENKKYHLYKLREVNDQIARTHGLGVIPARDRDRNARLPEKVMRMVRFNGRSHLLDLMQKADFARAYATSFDNYADILNAFDIRAQVQNKNITYFYPGKKHGKRGNKLGKSYDKPGLAAVFSENLQRANANPKLADLVWKQAETIRRDPTELTRALQNIFAASKGLTKFQGTGVKSRGDSLLPLSRRVAHSDLELHNGLVPISEITRAKSKSILDYARANKIGLTQNADGSHTLTGRPYVVIRDNQWTNTKNRTRGSLIDFVAVHRNVTFLGAIAEINGSPKLLEVERTFGKQERTFTSFYIPQEKRLSTTYALQEVNQLFHSFHVHSSRAASLLEDHQLQVARPGVIRLFSRNDYSAGLEFSMNEDQSWKAKTLGAITSPFHASTRGQRRAIVYTDPFTFFHHGGAERIARAHRNTEIVAMFTPDETVLQRFLSTNSHVKEVTFVSPEPPHAKQAHDLFVQRFKTASASRGLSVDTHFSPKRSPGRGPDVSPF